MQVTCKHFVNLFYFTVMLRTFRYPFPRITVLCGSSATHTGGRAHMHRLASLIKDSNMNVMLMGSPGSGKTVVGRILSKRLGLPFLDVDNDWLEHVWSMPVSAKLDQLGSDGFIQAEGHALVQCPVRGHIVSLTGSNPMHQKAMDQFRQTGIVVFLDVDSKDILSRLTAMKVDRIVGQGPGVSMGDILRYRQQFYETSYDLRILTPRNASPEAQADLVQSALESMDRPRDFMSTRQTCVEPIVHGLYDAVLQGLAPDGGLFVPKHLPGLSLLEWERLIHLSYPERTLRVLERWVSPKELKPSNLRNMINRAYSPSVFFSPDVIPVTHLEHNQYMQELYHGPSASFKDLALQLMPQLFQHAVIEQSRDSSYAIVVATSGDTGGATLDGFSRHTDIPVMVLYPKQGVSHLQKIQMTAAEGSHVHVVGVEGDFDCCQTAVKHVLGSKERKDLYRRSYGVQLSSANSINWARLLPQIAYHASGYLELVRKRVVNLGDPVDVCIPTGNFGNILAAFYAKQMGIPFGKLVVASNRNNVLTEFFSSGRYVLSKRLLQQTTSPAIDILKSSNLERLLYHLTEGNAERVKSFFDSLDQDGYFSVDADIMKEIRANFSAGWCSDENSTRTIHSVFNRTGSVLDPHTAVAKYVADNIRLNTDNPVLISATAHPAKFAENVLGAIKPAESFKDRDILSIMESVCGEQARHEGIWGLREKKEKHTASCKGNEDSIAQEIETFLAKSA